MKKELILTKSAKSDLRSIRRYIEQDDPQQARVFSAELVHKITWLADVDFTGSPRDYISEGLRGFPYRKRCIYYRSYADRIVIVRVLHGAQDITQIEFQNVD